MFVGRNEKAREALYAVKQSDWNEDKKNDFIVNAYSLLNLLTTAVFPLHELEEAVAAGRINIGVISQKLES